MATAAPKVRGGAWLLQSAPASDVFTPERMSEEHRLIARTAAEFSEQEVLPALERLETKDWALARALVKRCGDLGLLGVNVPEAYGGVELDKVSSLVVSEHMAHPASFGADVRCAGEPLHPAHPDVRDRGPEAAVSARSRERRRDWCVRAQ